VTLYTDLTPLAESAKVELKVHSKIIEVRAYNSMVGDGNLLSVSLVFADVITTLKITHDVRQTSKCEDFLAVSNTTGYATCCAFFFLIKLKTMTWFLLRLHPCLSSLSGLKPFTL
jgi:hypothetical protein